MWSKPAAALPPLLRLKPTLEFRGATSLNAALKEMGHAGYRPSGTPVRPWHEPVRKTLDKVDVDTLNLRKAEMKRAEEREAAKQLGVSKGTIQNDLMDKKHPESGQKLSAPPAPAKPSGGRARCRHRSSDPIPVAGWAYGAACGVSPTRSATRASAPMLAAQPE
jgi:hypothetical protein